MRRTAPVRRSATLENGPLPDMPSFGLRDLKGKGATDMWLNGEPIDGAACRAIQRRTC